YITSLAYVPTTTSPYFYTLSLHDALPISTHYARLLQELLWRKFPGYFLEANTITFKLKIKRRIDENNAQVIDTFDFHSANTKHRDRKSTRLNSSHVAISYAVFCLKKKKEE